MSEAKIKTPVSFSIEEILSPLNNELTIPDNNNSTELSTPAVDGASKFRELDEDLRNRSSEGGAIFKTSSLKTGNRKRNAFEYVSYCPEMYIFTLTTRLFFFFGLCFRILIKFLVWRHFKSLRVDQRLNHKRRFSRPHS